MNWEETRLIAAYLEGQGVVGTLIDVGAHSGCSAAPFLESGWTVHAFEPDAENCTGLYDLARVHPGLTVDPRAVSDREAVDVPFYTSPVSTGISGLSRFHESHREATRVCTTTLSAYCAEQGIQKVEFLKIDTEGFDLPVLRGFPWEQIRPGIVLCEFEDWKTRLQGYTLTDIAAFLLEHGYSLMVSEWYPVVEYGREHRWRRILQYPCALADSDAWGNLIAVDGPVDESSWLNASLVMGGQQLEQAKERMHQVDDQGRKARESLRVMESSWSWRITRPLRLLSSCCRKERHD